MRGNGIDWKEIDWKEVQLRLGLKGGACMSLRYQRRCETERAERFGEPCGPGEIDRALREEHPPEDYGPVWNPVVPLPDNDIGWLIGMNYLCLSAGVDGLGMLGRDANWRNHHDFLQLVAQAQSALRVVLRRAGVLQPDPDQELVFNWLKTVAREKQVKIHRYMRLDDEADPGDHEALTTRLYFHPSVAKKWRQHLWARLRERARCVMCEPDERARNQAWGHVAVSVRNLVHDFRVPSDDPDLVKVLTPLKDHQPRELEHFPDAFGFGLPEFRASVAAAWGPPASDPPRDAASPPTPLGAEAARVARALAERVVLFIGGEPRDDARRRLEKALGLKELRWAETRKHRTSLRDLEPEIARPEVALVVLLAFADHAHAGVRGLCDRYDKPFVQMPSAAGFGVDRIAREIIVQAGKDMGIDGSP